MRAGEGGWIPKILRMVIDDRHVVINSAVQDLNLNVQDLNLNAVFQRFLFLSKECGRFGCQRLCEVAWMDNRQSKVQNRYTGQVSVKTKCSTTLRFCIEFLSRLVVWFFCLELTFSSH